MTFSLGNKSLANLSGVHPDLVKCVERAIQITTQDFSVNEGLRSIEQQKKNVAAGVSQTMLSQHLTGHAVDLVPFIGGKLEWDWPGCYKIAIAMKQAANELGIQLVWGGVWDMPLNTLSDNMEREVLAYKARHGGKAFLDGPHFELNKEVYRAG